ncbi:MAG: type IX secretion system sortase PorU, partial [Bacteroidales bacterium]|nr:type IX secretion system sortase PorU [Bacteroidales bacterium]
MTFRKNTTYKNTLLCLLLMALWPAFSMAQNSVLSSGTWYKMAISSTGMYKLTYSELQSMGLDVNNIDPHNIRVFHNGGGVMPKINNAYYPDDLAEIPVYVYGEDDGVFNSGDYVLFYARGPVTWEYYGERWQYGHVKNSYSDYSYVFLTVGDEQGLRIQTADVPQSTTVTHVTSFLDHAVIDVDEKNLVNMGRTWYFDPFDVTTERSYTFSFPNIDVSRKAKLHTSVASRNSGTAMFVMRHNGVQIYSQSFGDYTALIYARTDTTCNANFTPASENISIDVKYSRSLSSSVGWLDYISVNAWRHLKMYDNMMIFRNPECYNATQVYEYQLQNASNAIKIWDVTNPIEPKAMNTTLTSSTLKFKVNGAQDNEFVAFTDSGCGVPTFAGTVANQNLHALQDVDYLIITHPDFQSQAERLKGIHANLDDLNIEIVQPQYIYNEFSGGAQDIGGIRAFIRMLYNKGGEHNLKYVLLFGDASYAYKNPSVCFIPTWESISSCTITQSVVTDDYFVCLDPTEGNMENETSIIDLPIGRMPVSTVDEATAVINKIESYISGDSKVMSNWRNVVTLVCDDESNHFIMNSEMIADSLSYWGADVITDKIYLDAYSQVATASGQRCPEMNEAITNRLDKGTLVMNYCGHGGEVGLADERIVTVEDINSWQNGKMLPLFVTATCEFSRFDDHTRTSAGEMAFTNSHGGAIAMITTARTTSGDSELLKRTYRRMFKMQDGEYPTMGDIFYSTKQSKSKNLKVFVLFGDPALRLAYPKNNVVLTKINGKDVGMANDTLKALSTIELQGEVRDNFGVKMDDFNGDITVSVYDKENVYRTKGDNGSVIKDFKLRNSVLFSGKAAVVNGEFNIRFMLPKDLNYAYGYGLISFYATDYVTDANGSYDNVIVGGYDNTALPDV